MFNTMAWFRAMRFALVAAVLFPVAALAQVKLQLVSADRSALPGKSTVVALRIQHEPGWHTYWINAGIGEPTRIQWNLPEGWNASPIEWPTPTAIRNAAGEVTGQGYDGLLLLPMLLNVPPSAIPGKPMALRAHVTWVMCAEICVPGKQDVSLSLPISGKAPAENASVRAELARMSMPAPDTNWRVKATSDATGVTLDVLASEAIKDVHFFSEDPFIPGDGQQRISGSPQSPILELPLADDVKVPSVLKGILGFTDAQGRHRGVSIDMPLQAGAAAATPGAAGGQAATQPTALPLILMLGFLGGLILNLMPCVFPVLGIKVLGFMEQSRNDRRGVTLHGLAFTAGVLVSFWALVALLAALRAGGATLGWGFQLQSAAFVYVLAIVMLVFALSLSGVFEFGLRATSVGSDLQTQTGYPGSALTGVLATVVATPCSAPFLAPALGAALTLPTAQSFLVFTVIGLGLSAPYLLLSIFPNAIRFLPRPGRWMETFRQLMAFPLYATVGWLVWVLAGQTSESGLLMVLLGLVAVAMAIWLHGRYQATAFNTRKAALASAAAVLLLLAGGYLGFPRPAPPQGLTWEPWSEARVAELRKEGRPIYVDFTARWCATCQANKKLVFGSAEVRGTMRMLNVALLKADWTNSDPAITRELARWNRSAVPFNLVYLPDQAQPHALPEVLTPTIVLDALSPKSDKR